MVRETRHLWVGNLPENISEERIREHFKRYGPVQSVKVVSGNCEDGVSATVAFVDICSAAKAHKADHRIEERLLKTTYYEPSLTALSTSNTHYPSQGSSLHRENSHYSSAAPQSNSHVPHGARSPRFSAGLNEDLNSYERSSHFYESRRDETIGYNGPGGGPGLSGVSVGAGVQGGLRRGGYPGDRESEFGAGSRGRVRSYPPRGHFLTNGRAEPGEYRWAGGSAQYRYHAETYADDKLRRGTQGVSPPPPPIPRPAARNPRLTIPSNKRRLPTSRSGSESPSSSRSSRSSSSSSSTSSSRSSSSRSGSLGRSSRSNSRSPRRIGNAAQSVSNTLPVLSPPGEKRPLAISVKNLPPWSSDNSLKDGLFHDYKKHGKVTTVRIFGTGSDRYAVVCFKKPEDAEKAFDASQDKQFFGVKIQVSPHEGLELDDAELRNYDAELDEYHPKATRTLFIGGLDKDVTPAELRKQFESFGEIIEIDIKKQNSSTFAFCQFSDIRSVVQAVKKMDGEHFGGNRIKLGFGKSMPNRCIWDRHATTGVNEMRGCIVGGKRLQIDFASRECQAAFYENLNKPEFPATGTADRTWERRGEAEKFDRTRREGSYIARQLPNQRIQNYTATRTRTRYEGFEEYNAGNFDEFADNSFERDLHEYAGRQRFENGPSTSAHTTTTASTTTSTTKHRNSFSPARKLDDKSPISPRSIAWDSENLSPVIRAHDEMERKAGRHRSTSDHDSFHSQSPPPRGRNSTGGSRMPSQSPSTPLATSPSREVTVVDDPRRRRPSEFKDLVVRVSDMRRPSNSPVRHRSSSNHRGHSDMDVDEGDSFTSRSELLETRTSMRREEPFSSGDERSLDGADRPCKKQKYGENVCGVFDKPVKRNAESFDYRARDPSPGFRKPFESSRKPVEGKFSKRDNNAARDDTDQRHRKASISACSEVEENSWRARDLVIPSTTSDGEFLSDPSPPGTPVRDEPEDPPVESSRRSVHSIPIQREKNTSPLSKEKNVSPLSRDKNTSPLSLPLPKFAHQVRLHLSPRGNCASPRGGSILRSPTFNTGTNWSLHPTEVNNTVDESDSVLADTPVSPGPALHDSISDSEESPSVSPTNVAGDLYERIKALDEKFDKWSGSRSTPASTASCRSSTTSPDKAGMKNALNSVSFLRKKRILDLEELKTQEPSSIMKTLLSKRSVFDEDSERLENISDKYEPRPFSSVPRTKVYPTLTSSSSYSVANNSNATSNFTSTTLPIPSATPLNSLPGIRRLSTSTSLPMPTSQATRMPLTPTSTVVSVHNISTASLSSTRNSLSKGTSESTLLASASTSLTVTATSSSSTVSSTATAATVLSTCTSVTSSQTQIHFRRSSTGSVSTPGPPQNEIKAETIASSSSSSSPLEKVCDTIVTVTPDTRVTGAVSVVQTSCSYNTTTTTTQAITCSSSSVQQPSPLLDSSLKGKHLTDEKIKVKDHSEERSAPLNIVCDKKVLTEKEQVQNSSESTVKDSTYTESNKFKVKDHFNSSSSNNNSNNSRKSESTTTVKIKKEPPDLPEVCRYSEPANIHKRRLSSTEADSSERRSSKSGKEFMKSDSKSLEPDNKKIKMEQEEEKENKSIKVYREKEVQRSERKERNKSARKEEVKENFEEKSIVQTIITGSVLTDVFDVKNESKHKKEDRLELREKLESHKINDFKEEKIMREGEREKKREKLEEKEKNQHFHKHVHSEKHRSIDKSTDRKLDRVEEKKDIKLECKDEKLEYLEEKRRDVKEENKLECKEEREEKVKDYDKRRHSEESKSREERKERSRDRKDKDRIRDKERHRSSFSHAVRDNERDKSRDRDKIRSKDKEKRHSKSSKSEERIKHQSEKHGEKKERRDTLSSLSSPSDHSSVSSIYCEKMAKHYPHKPIKPASQISVEHEEESDIGISSSCGHNKSYRPSQSKDLSDKGDEYGYQERINKESVGRKKHDSGKSEEKSKSHSSQKSSSSHYSKSSKSSIIDDDDERKLRIESDEISSDDDKMKVQLQPAKRTKQRANSSSSGSRRGRPKNKSILDTESESADSESDSEHKVKKPSYFDITIYDGNMYDKVKARREKSAQKPDDELKQKLKPKLLQQRSKRSKKALSSSCEAIQTESDDSDTEVLKKRGHARIHSSSEEESYIRSRTNQLSSEESDSTLPPIKYEKKKSISKDSKSKKCSQKILHVSDITTDEETVTNQSIDRHSGTDSEAEHQQSEQVLKIESESEMSEPGSRKPPRPALSASRNRLMEKEKLCRLSDKSSYLHKENRAEEETDMVVISEEVRHMKPKLRAEPLEVINNKITVCEKRKYSDSSIKEKGRKEGRMKAIFGLMSDDSDSNASPTTLPLTSPELVSATSYRKGSVSSGASSEPLHLTPPNQPRSQSGIYESDIDDDFRPATPDLPSQKRVSSDYENSVIDKNNVHCELKSLDGMKDILQESEVSKEEILNPCWRDVREQAVKETVCETSRAASDSGKGSSSGVSSASSSSGSSAEELLLLEARELSSSTFREEPEINIEIEKSNKFIFEREKELKESVPRKDKKKKKKHKDKESSRSHRHSCSKENRESHSHSVEKKSTRVIEEQPASHHLKFTANEEPATINSHRKDRSVRNSVSSNSSNNENVNIPTLEELHKVSTDLSTDIIPEVNNSPPLDMPLIKPDDLEPEPDQESNSDARESEGKLCDLSVDSESAVQSIASGNNNAPASTHAVYEITDGPCSPPAECTIEELPTKSSRSTISKEETLNAVASLLACYNDYREETSPPQTDDEPTAPIEVPIEQSEEAQKAAQLLQSEIGGGAERETEERDESWDESTVENVEESSGVMSPDHSETNNSSLSLSKKVSEEIHSSPKRQDVTIKEPLHFPDSPSSVQSEPALQIDEDEQLESLDTNISEEKVSVIKELATLPQERSSVWNTPESDIQEGKALGVMEDVTVQNIDKIEINVEETKPNTKTTVIAVTSEAYSSVTENTLNSEKEKGKAEDLIEKEVVPEKLPTVVKLNEEPVECKSISEPPKNENVSVFPIQQPVSSSSIENKDSICNNNSQTKISDTKPSDISKLEYEVKATISTPDRAQDVKSDIVEDIMPVNEKIMPQEPVVNDETTKPAEIIDELSIKTETKVEKECADIVNHEPEVLDLENKIDVEKDDSFMSDASHQLDTPNKSSEDMNRSFDSSFTEPFSTPEKDFRLDDQHEGRSLSVRGRARGRGRRGCRRLVDITSTPTGPSTILTRSSVSTRICKSRGRGRNARKPDTGDDDSVDTALPEQPRRSTRMKRARKHPDMVEHDETTNRRKRGGRSGKISGEEAALRASLSSSDVYDFHDSDDDELEMAMGNKKGKKDPSKPSTPRSPAKVSEETVDLQDGSLTRKSRRLRDKGHDGEMIPTSEGELEGETPPPPTTRSRGRGKKDIDDDDICNTPRKSPRNRSKISESEQDLPLGREIIGVNDPPIGEVVIQKLESPINNTMPSVVVPPKTLIIPCSTPKIYSNTIPPVSSTSQLPNMSVGAVPAIYSSTVNSHPVKLSIVQAGVRNISKGTPVTCVMTPQAYTAISNQNNPSALTVTSMPVAPQLSRENFVSQTIPFTVASPKDIPASPIKTVVSINCNSLPPSAFKAFPNGKKPDTIPTPLVDPVTGHLTPMKISDEGHYIPIAEHLQLAKDKLGQPLHQTKVLRAVLPSSITVTTISNSSPSVSVSIPNTVSTLVSSNRQVGICALPKGVNVTSLPRGSEVSVELVSRTRPTIPPTTTANIILSSSNSKGIPNFNTKSQISLTTSHGAPTPPLTNSVISSHVSMTQANTSNVVTIATPNKIFTTASSTLMTTTTMSMTRGSVLGGNLAQIKGPIPSKIQPVPVAKVSGSVPTGLNVQGIILTPSSPLHPNHRPEYSSQVIASNAIPQQPSSSSAGSIGTVSVSRIPPARVAAGTSHEQLIPEYVALGVSSRYQEQSARFREPPIVEIGRLPVGSPVSALSPVARGMESDPPPHLSNRQHYDLHPVTPNALGRQGMRNSPAGPMPHVQAAIGTKGSLSQFYDLHKKGGATSQPHPGVPPGVAVDRFLASPPLHTPPSTQTPPPAHHNTPVHRENLQINPIYHRGPYLVSDPRGVYGEKIANLAPMPMDLKVIEKGHLVEKSIQDDKDRPGSGPIPLSEFVSRPPTVITPHNPSSPHHLPSPHYDRSTDSPQVTMMYNRRYPHYDTNLYPNRAGTPGMEHDTLSRSPMSFSTLPPSDTHHSPRVQIPGPPQYASQVSPQMPTQTENLQYLLQGYPIMWDGILGLKNEQALVKMHFISGSVEVARGALPEGSTSHIRISQRMRLEQSQLEGVARKMQMKAEHCILMALPYGTNPYDLIKQQMSLETGFIKYLGEDKKAAGIVNVHLPGSQQSAFVIHIFPPCDFANENLARIAPELLHGVANTSRLLVIIATC